MKFKNAIKNIKIKLRCEKEKHDWEYCTWGNGIVDNLDGTFCFWDIATRTCNTCGRHQYNLKNGWEEARKGLNINDLI